jgi:site-specific recombinase XerD
MTALQTKQDDYLLPLDPKDFASLSTYKAQERMRIMFHNWNTTKTINEDIVESFLRYLKETYKPSSFNTYKTNFMQLLKKLPVLKNTENLERVQKQFKKHTVKLNHTQNSRVFTSDELKYILEESGEKESLFFKFLYDSACRVSEMLDCEIAHCKESGKIVIITVIGKGRKERKVRVPKELYLEIRNTFKGEKYLFEHNKKRYSRQYIYKLIKTHTGEEQKKYSPHNFRHSRATHLKDSGASYQELQELLGHSSVKTIIMFYDKTTLREELFLRTCV